MADGQKGVIHAASDGGVSGEHAAAEPFQFLVGPTTTDQFNTARLRLIPIACWRVDDVRFGFDSSFVNADPTPDNPNDIRTELRHLLDLVNAHPGAPLSVFGHADPVGSDDYNKLLSGRRAMVIYGLLVANGEPDLAVKLWRQVASTESWGVNQRQTMQNLTGLPSGTPDSVLFRTYLQKLCPPELKLTKQDFLGQGADAGGKGDYQGCSEFNPILIFSQEEQSKFDQAQQRKSEEDKPILAARNAANAPNRRVMVLFFRKGSKVEPSRWPCPRVSEGITGCKNRFWSDGEKRRSTHLAGIDRKYEKTEDTFACRFYQRISNHSPCERPLPRLVRWIMTVTVDQNKDVRLLIKDPSGAVVAQFTTADAVRGPGSYITFDFSGLDWSVPLRVEISNDPELLGASFLLGIDGLMAGLLRADLSSAFNSFQPLGNSVNPPSAPQLPSVDTSGASYQELAPPPSRRG